VIVRDRGSERSPTAEQMREVAGFLGVHPYGRRMSRLCGQPSAILRAALYGTPPPRDLAARLSLLEDFVHAAREALTRRAARAVEEDHRRWLREGRFATVSGSVPPLDALEDPDVVLLAIAALRAELAADPATLLTRGRDQPSAGLAGRSERDFGPGQDRPPATLHRRGQVGSPESSASRASCSAA
jgi:hypothetical protein